MRPALPALLLLLAAPAAAAPPADSPSKLLQAYFKAKKPDERAKALAAIEAAPPLDPKDVKDLRDEILKALAKAARSVPPKGKNEWFDEKTQKQKRKEYEQQGIKDPEIWKGLYFADGGSRKGLVFGFHGGGAGSGDAGSAQGAFSGVVGTLGFSALFPQVLVKTECGWIDPPETEQWVMEMVTRARVSWGIDPNRVYVTGHSMGGFGAWIFGSHYADMFAGGAAFSGAPRIYWVSQDKQDIEAEAVVEGYLPNLRNLPFFVFQSLDDKNVKPAANVFACARLKEMHEKDPQGYEFVYEQVDNLGHGFPKKGPKPGLEWATGHVRNPRPEKIVWQPTREWKETFYWIRWKEPWLRSILTATLDRAGNRVDLSVQKPREATVRDGPAVEARLQRISVYLDDRVLDLSKEVVIALDGKERYRGRPEPRLATLLRSCEEREDPEYAFACEAPVGPTAGK